MANENTISAVSAAIAGATSTITLHPLDTIKTKMQSMKSTPGAKSPTILDILKQIMDEGGIAAVYTGVMIKAAQSAVTKSMYFYNYAMLGGGKFKYVFTELFAGYVAELMHLPASMPLETVANRMICTKGLSPAGAIKQLINERGVLGFYSGLAANLAVSIQPAIHFGIFEQIKKSIAKNRSLSFVESFVYGGIARAISTLIIFPYIRAKVIAQTDPEAKKLSPIDLIKRELGRAGLMGL